MKNLSVQIDEEKLVITGISSDASASVARYENHLANFASYRSGLALSFPNGGCFGKIAYSVINYAPNSRGTGRVTRHSPLAQVTIEFLPEFGVKTGDAVGSRTSWCRQLTINFEFEGWRVVGTPKLEYLFTDLIIETGQERYIQQQLPLTEMVKNKPMTNQLRDGEALGCG
jgi:hypothetical protein